MSSFQAILNNSKPVLIDFYAEWCGPCKTMVPVLEELKKNMGDQIRILKIDIDKNQALVAKHQIRGVPTLLLIQEDKILWKQSGAVDARTLQMTIQSHL